MEGCGGEWRKVEVSGSEWRSNMSHLVSSPLNLFPSFTFKIFVYTI